MLKLAINYKEQLDKLAKTLIPYNNKYKYFNNSTYYNYEFYINTDDSYDGIDYVIVDKNDEVIGFIGASINRTKNKVDSLRLVNFTDSNYNFSKHVLKFIKMLLFEMNFNKIEFFVVIGNPAEKIYDKFIHKYGGKVVGIERESTKLEDNKYYDVKHYDVLRKEFKADKIK